MTTTNTLNKTEARAACKKAGISYTNMTVAEMRAALEAHELAHNEQGAAEVQTFNDHPSAADLPVEPEAVVTTVEPVAEVISEQRTDDAPAAESTPDAVQPLCATCDHIEELHNMMDATHAFSPKPAEPVKPKTPAVPKDARNGVSRPKDATGKCGQVWQALEALKAAGKEITFEALRAAVDSKIPDPTIRTQRQRWKTYNT